jgi:hypothetical protein
MSEDNIRQVIETLDAEIAEAGDAKSHLTQGRPAFMLLLSANRAGLLKFARTLLQVALEPILDKNGGSKPARGSERATDQVYTGKNDRILAWIRRMETWPESGQIAQQQDDKHRWRNRFALCGCCVVVVIVSVVFIVGLVAILSDLGLGR